MAETSMENGSTRRNAMGNSGTGPMAMNQRTAGRAGNQISGHGVFVAVEELCHPVSKSGHPQEQRQHHAGTVSAHKCLQENSRRCLADVEGNGNGHGAALKHIEHGIPEIVGTLVKHPCLLTPDSPWR